MLSIWEKQSFFAPSDIIIAGSGFTGLWSAWHLKKKHPGLRITIIDRGIIPTGASTRNAGFACFGSVTELMKDIDLMGEEKMLELVEMRYKGLERIQKAFRKKQIDFSLNGGHELISSLNADRYKELSHQIAWLNNKLSPIIGKKHVFHFANDKINRFGLAHIDQLIHTKQEGSLHPGKLCQALLQDIQGKGINVLSGMEISSFEVHEDAVTLTTSKEIDLQAKQLLICTNGFAKQLLPELEVAPARGQVLVTSPIPSLKLKGNFHYDEGYYYFRNLGNRVLLGGARNTAVKEETTYEMDTSSAIQQALETFLASHVLPGIPYEITHRWSGIMGMSPEKMPVIKKLAPRVFCAVGLSGMGVALAPVAGEAVMHLMTS